MNNSKIFSALLSLFAFSSVYTSIAFNKIPIRTTKHKVEINDNSCCVDTCTLKKCVQGIIITQQKIHGPLRYKHEREGESLYSSS